MLASHLLNSKIQLQKRELCVLANFKKQKIDTATYKRSFTFYSAQPEYMTEIYEDVLKKLQEIT